MKPFSKEDWKSATVPLIFLATLISVSVYFGIRDSNDLEENGRPAIGLVIGTYTTYKSSFARFFYRTPNGIYTAASSRADLKNYRYYRIRYSSVDPTVAEIYADSPVPDSIGWKSLLYTEISRASVVNGDQVPDWQW